MIGRNRLKVYGTLTERQKLEEVRGVRYLRYHTWESVLDMLSESISKFELDRYDRIYGIPRSGTLLAIHIALSTGAKLTHSILEADLVVEDVIASGRTFSKYYSKIRNKAMFSLMIHRYLVECYPEVMYYDVLPEDTWVIFPWEWDDWGNLKGFYYDEKYRSKFLRCKNYGNMKFVSSSWVLGHSDETILFVTGTEACDLSRKASGVLFLNYLNQSMYYRGEKVRCVIEIPLKFRLDFTAPY